MLSTMSDKYVYDESSLIRYYLILSSLINYKHVTNYSLYSWIAMVLAPCAFTYIYKEDKYVNNLMSVILYRVRTVLYQYSICILTLDLVYYPVSRSYLVLSVLPKAMELILFYYKRLIIIRIM